MSTGNSKVVFVGNVPYNMTEEQLVGIFKSVGQVVGFRLVFDRDTAKPKGYGFCEFADHETALSAVRNLNNTDCGGRPLRIDLADSDPFLEGKTTVRGEILDGGYPGPSEPRSHWRPPPGQRNNPNDPDAFLASIPPGKPVPKGASALDSISKTLAGMPQNQLMDVLSQMKSFVISHPDQARMLLIKHPQLSYALFQALLLNNIVDSAILERMLALSRGSAPGPLPPTPTTSVGAPPAMANRPPMSALPPHLQHHVPPPSQYPPAMPPFPPMQQQPPPAAGVMPAAAMMSTPPSSAMFPHSHLHPQTQTPPPPSAGGVNAPQQFYRPPMPPAGVPTQTQTQVQAQAQVQQPLVQQPQQVQPKPPAAAEISEAQRTMLMQVLSMSQEQINGLGDTERMAIMELRNRFGTLAST